MLKKCALIAITSALFAASAFAKSVDMVLYTHPTIGFSLLLPSVWRFSPTAANYDVQVQDPNCLLQVASATMAKPVDPGLFAAEWERQSVGPEKTYLRRVSQNDRTVAGVPAIQGIYDSTVFGAPALGNLTMVSFPDRTYVISLIFLRQAYGAQGAVIEAVLASFQPAPASAIAPKPSAGVPAPPVTPDAYLGLEVFAPADQDARRLGLTAGQTVVVAMVRDLSPAAKAGIESGDVIVGISGRVVRTVADLQAAPTPRGQPVEVVLVRRGETRKIKVTPGVRPAGLPSLRFSLASFAGVLTEQVAGWSWMPIPGSDGRMFLSKNTAGGTSTGRIEIDRMSPGWSSARAVVEGTALAKQRVAQQHSGAGVIDGPPYTQRPGLGDTPGVQFEAEYSESGKPQRQWTVVVSDGYGGAIIWFYVAGDDSFDANLPEAREMLKSLVIFPRPVAGGVR